MGPSLLLRHPEIVIVPMLLLFPLVHWLRWRRARRRLTPTIAWINATYAVLSRLNRAVGTPWVYVGGRQRTLYNRFGIARQTASSWGRPSRKNMQELVDSLAAGEKHNAQYADMVRFYGIAHLALLSEEGFAASIAEFDQPTRRLVAFLRDGHRRWGLDACLAWDLCRATQLLGWSYLMRLRSYDGTLTASIGICRRLQDAFGSWDDLLANYLFGAMFWQRQSAKRRDLRWLDPKRGDPNFPRVRIIARLQRKPNGPYATPWGTELRIDWHEPSTAAS